MSPVIVIAGPTASGKSDLAMTLALTVPAVIISCDSVQIYRGFDLGAAKPSASDQAAVPHEMLDIIDWTADYDAARYAQEARLAVRRALAAGRIPLVVGGSGLYLRALMASNFHAEMPKDEALRAKLGELSTCELASKLAAVDAERAAAIHQHDRFRLLRAVEIVTLSGRTHSELYQDLETAPPEFHFHTLLLEPERQRQRAQIAQRVTLMLNAGLVAEVERLLAAGCPASAKPMQSIGYRQVAAVLQSEAPAARLGEAITIATSQYAKRQNTWNRKLNVDWRGSEHAAARAVLTSWANELLAGSGSGSCLDLGARL